MRSITVRIIQILTFSHYRILDIAFFGYALRNTQNNLIAFLDKIILILFFTLSMLSSIDAQQKFDCDGSAYVTVVDENENTSLIELTVGDQDITQSTVFSGFGNNINAIGFNRTDSLIYGIDPEVHQLFRIGADGVVETVKFLPLIGNYFAGDVSPLGDQLVLFNRDSLAVVDLTDSEMPVDYRAITTTTDSLGVFTTDIAFHPVTQVLYGYDAVQGKLITIDVETGVVDNTSYPSQNFNSAIPAMFFDARGELYGIGTNSALQESTLFHFDLETGTSTRSGFDSDFGDRDGCSCPYTLKLFQKKRNAYVTPCARVELVLTVANLTGQAFSDFSLRQDLPDGYLIEEIVRNAYPSVVHSGAGTSTLSLSAMDISQGIDSIVIAIQIPEYAGGDMNEIQAELFGQDAITQATQSILSNDLDKGEKNAPTDLFVEEVFDIFQEAIPNFVELCEGDTFSLRLPSSSDFELVWRDSFPSANRDFTESGDFILDIITSCSTTSIDLMVRTTTFSVDLGEDIDIDLGELVFLNAMSNSFTPIVDFTWQTLAGEIPCGQCPTIQVRPREDTKYILLVENETGCTTTDEINIFVNREVYVPNIFSPNGDGINDYFYLLSGFPSIKVLEFNIYNRWGAQVFGATDSMTNQELSGWDGKIKGKLANAGAYVWTAIIQMPNGRKEQLRGQLILTQ